MAAEYAAAGLRVNAIAPGWHAGTALGAQRRARMTPDELEHFNGEIIRRIPMRRRGRPEELVGLAVYLASDASSYVTGQVISHDGGWDAAVT
jgi:NAD(P)-dependent dehydrogenase (short-subunit alcohol dehydrogenase family)